MAMQNAQVELVKILKDATVLYGYIIYEPTYDIEENKAWYFNSSTEFAAILPELDFMYDSGYGRQYLFGTIVLENNRWLTRGEYHGSEWWELHKLPTREEVMKYSQSRLTR